MVNLAFRQSFLTLQNGDGAYIAFIAFYVVCCLVTWVVFMRQRPCWGSSRPTRGGCRRRAV
jgi:NNP family nitrate/nitrite transporter-like MFS transporter